MMKTSNFGTYFRYQMSKKIPSLVIFAVLNFFSTALLSLILLITFNRYANNLGGGLFYYIEPFDFIQKIYVSPFLISIIMIVVTTARSMKLYHNRAAMDMLGSLPLSYGDRFRGDILSSIAVNFISLAPFSVITFFLNIALKKPIRILSNEDSYFSSVYGSLPDMMNSLLITIILVYLGVYALTFFVSTCCGKTGSAVIFSFIAMAVVPGIFTTYGDYFFSNVIGSDPNVEIVESVGMLPPLGPIFSLIIALSNGIQVIFINEQPFCLVIFLLLTAAMITGAYFIGKRRRAEKVGESFVFKSVYHVLSLTLIVMMIGVFSSNVSFEKGLKGFIYVLLITLGIYFALELTQTKSFMGSWKILLRFTMMFIVCVAFLNVISSTNSFGVYKNLPGSESVKEVKISGKYFYAEINGRKEEKEYVFRAVESVSGILEEHEKLLQNDNISNGYQLKITYYLKSGRKMTREYGIIGSDESIKSFSDAVKQLPDYTLGSLGVLDRTDFTDYNVVFRSHINDMPEGYIRSDKIAELAENLRYDIENNYTDEGQAGNISFIIGDESSFDWKEEGFFMIREEYERTMAFLRDPNNYKSADDNSEVTGYYIRFNDWGSRDESVRVFVSVDDTSEAAKELLSYIKPLEGHDNDVNFYIIAEGRRYLDYMIESENTTAALKAMYTLFREKYAN